MTVDRSLLVVRCWLDDFEPLRQQVLKEARRNGLDWKLLDDS